MVIEGLRGHLRLKTRASKLWRAMVPLDSRAHLRIWKMKHNLRYVRHPDWPVREMRRHLSELFPSCEPLRPGTLVVDLGANDGWFSFLAASLGAQVIMVEPNPWCFSRAVKRTARFEGQVTALNVAIAEHVGWIELHFPDNYERYPMLYSGSASTIPTNSAVGNDSVRVRAVTMDHLTSGLEKVDFLKVDVEGAEEIVWRYLSAKPELFEYVAMETHTALLPSKGQTWLNNAEHFIESRGLGQKWRLDWP